VNEEEARKIVINPLITEKGTSLQEKNNQYLLRVDPRSNKIQVKSAVEKLFNVSVTGVRMMKVKGKKRRMGRSIGFRPGWKKAIVTLKEGETISLT